MHAIRRLAAAAGTATLIAGGVFVMAPAAHAAACPSGEICLYSGLNETGTQFTAPALSLAVPRENVEQGTVIRSVTNQTSEIIQVDGRTCAHPRVDALNDVLPGTSENLPEPDDANVCLPVVGCL
ncbi:MULTISPECIES: peptidase inhibitor family I36 protein [unclassified Streptomyces]|uniref:peptidase inhibitor family I36 protein n=1 Tax=unclassified Streptomyces TaxID=2593676 RepID=UPI0038118A9F